MGGTLIWWHINLPLYDITDKDGDQFQSGANIAYPNNNYPVNGVDDAVAILARITEGGAFPVDGICIIDHGVFDPEDPIPHAQMLGEGPRNFIGPTNIANLAQFVRPGGVIIFGGCGVAIDEAYCKKMATAAGSNRFVWAANGDVKWYHPWVKVPYVGLFTNWLPFFPDKAPIK